MLESQDMEAVKDNEDIDEYERYLSVKSTMEGITTNTDPME